MWRSGLFIYKNSGVVSRRPNKLQSMLKIVSFYNIRYVSTALKKGLHTLES